MKLHTRKRIFYALVLLFVVIGAAVVLFAEGWRIDFSSMQARKAGGIYIRSFPSSATITLNGESVKNQSGFLSPGTFIAGLFPKTYTVTLSAPGYDAWTESPAVAPSLVTELKYSVLVPSRAQSVASGTDTADFFAANSDIVTTAPDGVIAWRGRTIGHGTVVSHSIDLRTAIIRSANAKGGVTYWLYDFTLATSTNLSSVLQANGIAPTPTLNVFIDPYDGTGILVQTRTHITRIDAETRRADAIETTPAGTSIETPIAISPSVMAWARFDASSGSSRILVYDKFSGDMIDSSLVVPGQALQLSWVKNGRLAVLENDHELFLYDVPSERLTKLADDVTQCYPTGDGNTIAALEHRSLEVFAFTTQDYYRFSLPQIADVEGLSWYRDNAHLFVQYPDRIAFLDLADARLRNLTAVSATTPGTKPAYDQQANALYLIDQGRKLLRFDFPQ